MVRVASLLTLFVVTAGCSLSREVPLWPIIDLERPQEEDPNSPSADGGGFDLTLFWPFFNIDTRGAATKHYLFPLYSYNGEDERGSFAALVHTGWGERRYFTIFPFYWWGRDGDESWHHLFPLAGMNRSENESLTYVLPYFSFADTREQVRGLIVPPALFSRSHDGESGWFWILNTIRSWNPDRDSYFFFPFIKRARRNLAEGSEVTTYIFPTTTFLRKYERGATVGAKTSVWPFYKGVTNEDEASSDFLRFPTFTFDGIQSRSLIGWGTKGREEEAQTRFELFPFYAAQDRPSRSGWERRIPLLGLSWWENWQQDQTLFGSQWRSQSSTGWAAWPFFGLSHSRASLEEAERATHHRALAGLYRYDHDPGSSWRVSLLHPLQEISRRGENASHRLWPLYRYSNQGENRTFVSLAEIFGVRVTGDLDDSPSFFLHPFSYQRTPTGDHHFRFLWKLIESRKKGAKQLWAVQPLIYTRSEPNTERFLILGGLFGLGRDDDREWVRLLWLFNFGG